MTEEDKRALETGKSWEEFGAQFGWKLRGWTFDNHASFWITYGDGYRYLIEISKHARADMQVALDKALAKGSRPRRALP